MDNTYGNYGVSEWGVADSCYKTGINSGSQPFNNRILKQKSSICGNNKQKVFLKAGAQVYCMLTCTALRAVLFLALAEKLGYCLDYPYVAYELEPKDSAAKADQ